MFYLLCFSDFFQEGHLDCFKNINIVSEDKHHEEIFIKGK